MKPLPLFTLGALLLLGMACAPTTPAVGPTLAAPTAAMTEAPITAPLVAVREALTRVPTVAPPTLPVAAAPAIVYSDMRHVWVLEAAQPPRALVQGATLGWPVIAPDRAWVAYVCQCAGQPAPALWVVRWDGRDAHKVVANSDLPSGDLPAQYGGRQI